MKRKKEEKTEGGGQKGGKGDKDYHAQKSGISDTEVIICTWSQLQAAKVKSTIIK